MEEKKIQEKRMRWDVMQESRRRQEEMGTHREDVGDDTCAGLQAATTSVEKGVVSYGSMSDPGDPVGERLGGGQIGSMDPLGE